MQPSGPSLATASDGNDVSTPSRAATRQTGDTPGQPVSRSASPPAEDAGDERALYRQMIRTSQSQGAGKRVRRYSIQRLICLDGREESGWSSTEPIFFLYKFVD